MKIRKWMTLLGLLLMVLLLVACGRTVEPSPAAGSAGDTIGTTGGDTAAKPMITLIENPWPASELNVAVAKILIEQELGNPVEVIALDENTQWDALSSGDADASLEVWPSGHSERITEYIDNLGTVENGGALGPVGEIGWFVPQYVVDARPELATWEGYLDAAALFATAETGGKGRFLGADPSWVQYDEQIIANLGLPFQVIWAGSEEALLAEVAAAYNREAPVLFYFYSPHAVFEQFEMVQVALPPYSDDCYADEAAIDCAYPQDVLFKIFSAELATKDNAVYTLLSKMNYGSEAQIAMLAKLNDGLSVEEAAQSWVDTNQTVWQAWLP